MNKAFAVLLATMTISAAAQGQVATDLERRLAKYKPVSMPFTTEGLTAREKKLVNELVAASREMEEIFWRQYSPEDIQLYKTATDQRLKHFLWVNGGRWDLIDENHPFVGSEPLPPGKALYPEGITREQIEQYVKDHPEQRAAIYDGYTVVELVSRDPLRLKTTPYRVKYRPWLQRAAQHLRNAADSSDDKQFARFLRLRAKALLTDDYFESDLVWMELEDPKFDVIFGPYETYIDGILGVKTAYESVVMVRNDEESRKLAVFQKYVPDIQDALPLPAEDRSSKRGHKSPMEVMDAPFRAGDIRHGYQAVAVNLPNDPRVHEKYGTKKMFMKNYMDARVNHIILPLARRVMRADQAAQATGEGYLTVVMMHEVAHGLGPAFARIGGKQIDIREAIGPSYSALEEAKADIAGLFGLQWLVQNNALPRERLQEYYASYVAGIFRTVRFGTAEAHGRAEMMEFNFLTERGALSRDARGMYVIDYTKMPDAIAALAKELLEMEAAGDRARAEGWLDRYDDMPADLRAALDDASRYVPVDFDPLGTFREGLR